MLFKQLINNSEKLMAEVNQLRHEGKKAELIVYREGGSVGSDHSQGHALPAFGKDGQPVQTLSRISLPFLPPDKQSISSLNDLYGCIMVTILFSMLFSPAIIIGDPLMMKLEKAGESAKNQKKDAEFYLNAFPKSKKDFAADFEALQFSNPEKNQPDKNAKLYDQNVYRNDSLRKYISQSFDVLRLVGRAVLSQQEA